MRSFAGQHLFAEQAPDDVVVDGQAILRKDRVAELLELFQDFVIDSGVVVIRTAQQHHTDAVFALQLFQSFASRAAHDYVVEDRIGVVLLGRPYHNDPGVNHEILEEFQKLGYPVFAQDCLPIDDDIIWRLFGEEVLSGEAPHPMSINDVWKNSYSENTSRKVWAAKYVARHPNLVALELSSFKCGHDAPIYTVVEEIVEHSGTPYFCFKDIDENKPTGSIRIRVETIGYFLKRYREDIVRNKQKATGIDQQMREFEARLRRQMLREKLDQSDSDLVRESFEAGSMPQIHVSLGALQASKAPEYERVSGD